MSLDFRRDIRTVEVFAKNISDYTNRERIWAQALRLDFCERGWNCSVEENGVDNTGKLINKKVTCDADKLFVFKERPETLRFTEELIEIKCWAENLSFMTFKVNNFKSYIEQGANVVVPRTKDYHFFYPAALIWMLDNLDQAIYRGFSANDLAVRISMNQVENLLKKGYGFSNQWLPQSSNFINENKNILTKDKVR